MDIDNSNDVHSAKRKASGDLEDHRTFRKIRRLDPDVVNKIAAGEIIVAPAHAIKELIENAVDASSTSVEVVVKDGGFKLLQVTDNGHGINRADLPILCERFTTSKIIAFEDLTSISTYGFRGEALASISHVAHLTVTTKTADSSCAWRAVYADGKLAPAKPGQSSDPKATAGRQGTQITIEDLFYNMPRRRKTLRSASEEYSRILELVGRYAIHCTGVALSCKKFGDSLTSISVPASATAGERIRQIYGSSIANELVGFETSSKDWGFKANGWVTNVNYNAKKTAFILFINHRAVESAAIKKAMEQTYSSFLPKNGHGFIYLSLEIEPHRVDVNVHPTKKEVFFLDEDEVIGILAKELREKLSKSDESRIFVTKSLVPEPSRASGVASSTNRNKFSYSAYGSSVKRVYDHDLIRTDSRERKITTMLPAAARSSSPIADDGANRIEDSQYQYISRTPTVCRLASIKELRANVVKALHGELGQTLFNHVYVGIVDFPRRIAAIQSGIRLLLVDYGMLANELFYQIGLSDFGNYGAFRFDPPLSLKTMLRIGTDIERARQSDSSEDVDWNEVIDAVYKQIMNRRDMLAEYFELTISEDGELTGIPLLLKDYIPSLAKLPHFLLRLGPYVNWKEEKPCFESFLAELASFYTPETLPNPPIAKPAEPADGSDLSNNHNGRDQATHDDDNDNDNDNEDQGSHAEGVQNNGQSRRNGSKDTPAENASVDETNEGIEKGATQDTKNQQEKEEEEEEEDHEITTRRAEVEKAIEHIFFPAFKTRLVATKGLLSGVMEIADLKSLYKVFERC